MRHAVTFKVLRFVVGACLSLFTPRSVIDRPAALDSVSGLAHGLGVVALLQPIGGDAVCRRFTVTLATVIELARGS